MPAEHGAVAVERRAGPPVRPKAPWQSEMAASNSASKGRARASSALEGGAGAAPPRWPGRRTRWQMSTPCDLDAPLGRARGRGGPGRSPRRGPACPARSAERVDEEVDLLLGALGERVAQVGAAQVVGDAARTSGRRSAVTRSWGGRAVPLGREDLPVLVGRRSRRRWRERRQRQSTKIAIASRRTRSACSLTIRLDLPTMAPSSPWRGPARPRQVDLQHAEVGRAAMASTTRSPWPAHRRRHLEDDLVVHLQDQAAVRRLARSSARSRRTSATLKMSAARPWMPAFMAWRSPAWRMR